MTKPLLKIEDVAKFHAQFHRKVRNNPTLYRSTDTTVTIILPKYLLQFAEYASGHSGFKFGARPLGLRRHQVNSSRFIAEVFASVESLYKFIQSSACDAYDHQTGAMIPPPNKNNQTITKPIANNVVAEFVPAKNDYWGKYSAPELSFLRNKYGSDLVTRAMTLLSLTEMENLFGM